MKTSWRDRGSVWFRRAKPVLAPLVSIGLVTWLVWSVSPRQLFEALASVNWPWLVLATFIQVVGLFVWDTVSLWWLFGKPDRRLSFRTVLRLRCDTEIWSALSLEIGQAAFAYKLARAVSLPTTNTFGYCVLLGLVDMGTLLSLALFGSFLRPSNLTAHWRWVCIVGLVFLAVLVVAIKIMPRRWHHWLSGKPWADWLQWLDWRMLAWLWIQRLILFLLVLVYAGVGLAICRVRVDPLTVVGIVPFVVIAESMPGTAGLGERETALVYFFSALGGSRPVLLSFGLIWSAIVILTRIGISLVSWSLPRADHKVEVRQFAPSRFDK